MRTKLAALLTAALLAAPTLAQHATPGGAHEEVGPIRVDHAWSRATPPTARTAALYLTITNTGDAPDRLIGASTEVAEDAHLHAHRIEDGVARMHAVEAIEIGPGESVALEPGGLHIMLVSPKRPLAEGDTFTAELTFAAAGSVAVEARVESIGATGPTPPAEAAGHEHH